MPSDGYAGRGVLIVPGGPQYRIGSHRQLVTLSRHLASSGLPVLRFDHRGMGDSEGAMRIYEDIEEDLRTAIDTFFRLVPRLNDVVIWGLCGSASAAALYAHADSRVSGLVLANPWVRTPYGQAQTMVKHYYFPRLLRADLWKRLISGKVDVLRSLREVLVTLRAKGKKDRGLDAAAPLPDRMAEGLRRFQGRVLIYLSGDDLTAKEFEEAIKGSKAWEAALHRPSVQWRRLPDADHTYSNAAWRDQVNRWTSEWSRSW
jgi:exosortase A-associated hydrolase 1